MKKMITIYIEDEVIDAVNKIAENLTDSKKNEIFREKGRKTISRGDIIALCIKYVWATRPRELIAGVQY